MANKNFVCPCLFSPIFFRLFRFSFAPAICPCVIQAFFHHTTQKGVSFLSYSQQHDANLQNYNSMIVQFGTMLDYHCCHGNIVKTCHKPIFAYSLGQSSVSHERKTEKPTLSYSREQNLTSMGKYNTEKD